MKSRLPLVLALAAFLLALPAAAGSDPKAQGREAKATAHDKEPADKEQPAEHSQQNKMKVCNAEAGKKSLKGDERRAFMSACLKG